ncbi:MAG: transketolase C-terminal domain-containing protein [Pseudomonadota bacterium]
MRSIFSRAIVDAARADSKILMLTGDHGYALFDEFRRLLPDQFINAGVAEQNMVGVAAGLAKAGFKPIVYGLNAFVPIRVLEQIKLDVCYEGLAVTFIGDGAGVVYSSLGSSHQSTEDIAILRAIPGIRVLSPCDPFEMEYAMRHALRFDAPLYLRMGKSDLGAVHETVPDVPLGDLISVKEGTSRRFAFFATGSMVQTAIALAHHFNDSSVWSVPSIKPINRAQIYGIAKEVEDIFVLEEHTTEGGVGGLIAEIVSETAQARVIRLGIEDRFSAKCGSYNYLLQEHGIDLPALISRVTEKIL